MDQLVEDFGHPTHLAFQVIVARLTLAAFLGGVVGFEREWRNHPAGLRTHVLVCIAACAFAVLGIEIVHSPQFEGDASRLDPLRLIEAVTAGVAFLAAGTIIFARGRIRGLTTGAGLWLAGAIGLAAGLGFWQVAALATILAVLVLGLMQAVERALLPGNGDSGGDGGDRPASGGT